MVTFKHEGISFWSTPLFVTKTVLALNLRGRWLQGEGEGGTPVIRILSFIASKITTVRNMYVFDSGFFLYFPPKNICSVRTLPFKILNKINLTCANIHTWRGEMTRFYTLRFSHVRAWHMENKKRQRSCAGIHVSHAITWTEKKIFINVDTAVCGWPEMIINNSIVIPDKDIEL